VKALQNGTARASWMAAQEKRSPDAAVRRLYQEVLGRKPSAAALKNYADQLRAGTLTRAQLRTRLADSTEALLKPKAPAAATKDQLDAKAYIDGLLDDYGLGALKSWAWKAVQSGDPTSKIIQDLRDQPAYKTRFAIIEARRKAGLPAMSEAEVFAYENAIREIVRRAGLPAALFAKPKDFLKLAERDISPIEVSARIEDGFSRVRNAPAAVRDAFGAMYGIHGDANLAAFFLDPDRAEPILLRQAEAARISGFGTFFDLELGKERAEQIAQAGRTSEDAEAAFAQVDRLRPIFDESVTEREDLTPEREGLDAALGLAGGAERAIDRRVRTRTAALAGGGGAAGSSQGLGLGSAD
jgi:hypothetical protein